MSDDRTLALRTQVPPDVAELAALIKTMLPNGKSLSDQEAIAGAMYGKSHGLDVFKQEFYIVPGRGIYPGYRGEMKLQAERAYYTQTRPLRSDEADEHEIGPGDTARIVELYQPDLMAQMRTLGIPYRPIAGLGIVRKSEKTAGPPTGRSWAWKAEQRALKDAMRHMQGGADLLDMTVDEQLAGATHSADTVLADFRQLPAAEQRATFERNVKAMRGDPERNPYDDAPPTNGHDAPPPEDTTDAEFERIPNATQEREQTIGDSPATAAQVQRLGILVKKLYPSEPEMYEFREWLEQQYHVKSRKELTVKQANALIETLVVAERKMDAADAAADAASGK